MHIRFACIRTNTTCDSCGQPVPMNGPCTSFTCSSCNAVKTVPPDVLGGIINDFEDEYDGLSDGQGSGGTLMCGSGTYRYRLLKLPPRCSGCGMLLPPPYPAGSARIGCPGCGRLHHLFPAPDWMKRIVPSAVFCLTGQPAPDDGGVEPPVEQDASQTPVVMSCPKCAGTLSVTTGNERIMKCGYCGSEVYIPDAVWTRLHPVRKSVEWFLGLSGPTRKQIDAQRRLRDLEEERRELGSWKVRATPGRAIRGLAPLMPVLGMVASIGAVLLLLHRIGGTSARIAESAAPVAVIVLVIALPVWIALRTMFTGRFGPSGECRRALGELAAKHGWKHEGAQYRNYTGTISAKYRGRDIGIDPAGEYAIEADLDDSAFYLRSEPPGYPPENLQRFTTSNGSFNDLFPIRYATPEAVERMGSSGQEEGKVLQPFTWFMKRWEGRIGRMLVDWSGVQVHIAPGHVSVMESPRYLLPEDIEPLLDDMVTLAAAIGAVGAGRDPELPGPTEPPSS